jgi:hypothetical protein
MKTILFLLIIFLTTQAYSHEIKYPEGITDIEYISYYHTVTYFAPSMKKVECTVLTKEGKPIAGSSSYVDGGVSTIILKIPQKYKEKRNLQYICTATTF